MITNVRSHIQYTCTTVLIHSVDAFTIEVCWNDIQSDNRKFRSHLLVGKNCTTLYGDGCWTLVW